MREREAGRSAAPRALDPILATVEWLDRAIHGIRPVQDGALLAIQPTRHRGSPQTLADGTPVRRGDRVEVLHFINSRVRELAGTGWQGPGLRQAEADLAALATRLRETPVERRPVAYRGATVLAALAKREGFQVMERPPGLLHAMDEWYQRTLLARWSPEGRGRLARGRHALRSREVWLSTDALLARFAGDA